MGDYIGKIQVDNGSLVPIGSTLYGTCSSTASDEIKDVTIEGGVTISPLIKGLTIFVKFTYTNTNSTPKLRVPGQNAFPIYRKTNTYAGVDEGTSWTAGSLVSLTYDSNAWYLNDHLDQKAVVPNDKNHAGVVANPNGTSSSNRVWETDSEGNPAWRDFNLMYLSDSDTLLQAIQNLNWHADVIVN